MATSLDELTALARAMSDADAEVAAIKVQLSESEERARRLHEETLPAVMQELGVEKIVLSNGQTLTVKQDVYASIPADGRVSAYDWLTERGFEGLIKTDVSVAFGRGELDNAKQLRQTLEEQGFTADLERGVHAQTLKAFLREQLAGGADVPLETFGARPVWVAKLSNK